MNYVDPGRDLSKCDIEELLDRKKRLTRSYDLYDEDQKMYKVLPDKAS